MNGEIRSESNLNSMFNLAGYLRVAKYSKLIEKELTLKVLCSVLVTATYVAQAVFLARGTGLVFEQASFQVILLFYLLVLACIGLRSLLINYLGGYTKKIAGKLKTILRERVVGKLLELGPGYQVDKRSGRFQSLVTDGIEYLEPYLVNYVPQIFITLLSVIPLVIYIFTLQTTVGIIVTVSVILAIVMPHFLMPFYTKACVGYWQEYAVLNSQYIDTMQGMNTLKLFNMEKTKGRELAASSEKFRLRQLVNTRYSLLSSDGITLMIAVATSITTGIAAISCSRGALSAAGLLNIMFLVIECVRPVGALNDAWHASNLGLSVASELLDILEEPVAIQDQKNSDEAGLEGGLPQIEFENVCFQYSSEREYALRDVSLQIGAGETIAIVGSSGSGKSTLVNLLLRFYDVGAGRISINGTDIRDFNLEYLRSRIAVVFQNTYLFYGTIRDNVRMAAPDATDEEIECAAKSANAHDFILSLPHGYNTVVGERGATLSGGQRQRIAIARAILKNAPILVLDEATSSVDAASEAEIQETLERLNGRFTTIIIAHRLSTIRNANRIYVLNQGSIAEEGTHAELLKAKGIYRNLTVAQNGGLSNEYANS